MDLFGDRGSLSIQSRCVRPAAFVFLLGWRENRINHEPRFWGRGCFALKKTLIWLIPTVAVVGLVIWRFANVESSKSKAAKPSGGNVAEVQVVLAKGRLVIQRLQGVGDVQSPEVVEISPKTAGRIDYLVAREGDVVTPGELLLKIDPSDLTGAMLQMQANVAEARQRLAQAKLTQNATSVGVKNQIQVQKATLRSDKANLALAQQNYNSEVGAAQSVVTSASSGVVNAQAALDKENATLKNVQLTYDRTLNLFKQNFIASQDVDNAKTALEVEKGSVGVAKAQLEAANATLKGAQDALTIATNKGKADIAAAKAVVQEGESNLKLAEANKSARPAYQENLNALQSEVTSAIDQLTQAQARLSDTIINSPISGTVTARKADPGDQATPGSPVLEVQYLDWLYVTSTLPIDFSTQIHAGQIADITIDGLPGRTFSGPIININPAADPLSRQFGIKVKLANKDHTVRPGMYGRVSIVTNTVFAGVVVPKEAITTPSTGSPTVTVVGSDNVAHVVKVTEGVSDDTGSQITSGVKSGDQVVVLTYNTIKDGQKVKVSAASNATPTTGPSQGPKSSTVNVKASKVKP
jgi:RND family efflux transporter MFP subunit